MLRSKIERLTSSKMIDIFLEGDGEDKAKARKQLAFLKKVIFVRRHGKNMRVRFDR